MDKANHVKEIDYIIVTNIVCCVYIHFMLLFVVRVYHGGQSTTQRSWGSPVTDSLLRNHQAASSHEPFVTYDLSRLSALSSISQHDESVLVALVLEAMTPSGYW